MISDFRRKVAFWTCPQIRDELSALRSANTKVVLANGRLLDRIALTVPRPEQAQLVGLHRAADDVTAAIAEIKANIAHPDSAVSRRHDFPRSAEVLPLLETMIRILRSLIPPKEAAMPGDDTKDRDHEA